MDANKFTQKSLQAVQSAQNLAVEYGNPELTALHLALALMDRDGLNYRIVGRMRTGWHPPSRTPWSVSPGRRAVLSRMQRLP